MKSIKKLNWRYKLLIIVEKDFDNEQNMIVLDNNKLVTQFILLCKFFLLF